MATTTFNDLITFSRGSNATVTGPNGLIQWAPSNLVLNSQDLEAATWTKNSSSATANNATAPDGTQTADTWIPTSSGNTAGVRLIQTVTTPVGFVQTASVYVKSAGKRWVYMTTPAALSPAHNCWFDVQNGVVGTMGGAVLAATITPAGSGWFRITTTSATTLSSNYIFLSTPDADNSDVVTANGTGIQIWGAQVELGSTATTYNNTSVRNLLGFSEAFDNAGWSKSRASIVTGAQANPVNGLFNAQKLMEDTTASNTHLVQLSAGTVGTPETLSIYAKPAGRSWIRLQMGSNATAYFDVANGVVGANTNCTPTITAIGNGWYRCAVSSARPTNGNNIIYLANADNGLTYTGDGNSGVYIYGAQLSNSASLDPYAPTPGAAPSSTAYYGPRFDYDPATLLPRGLLVEEQRTNLALTSSFGTLAGSAGSQYPSGTGWSNLFNTGGTRTYVPSAVFSGAQAMDIASVSTARSVIAFSFAAASSTTYAVSFYVESVSGVTGTVSYATGVLGTGGTTNAIIAPTTPGRYTYTFTTGTGAGTVDVRFGIGAAGNESGSIRISNAQVEAGAFATSYIPTIASTVTRSADVATITGSLFSQWYNQPEGSFLVEAQSAISLVNQNSVYSASDNTQNNRIVSTISPESHGAVVTGGVLQANLDAGTPTAGATTKIAFATRVNDFAASLNGGTVVTDTSGTMPTVSRLVLGANGEGSAAFLNGHIRSIRYVPVRAADFQLQQVTT
jgi:hypothetical protein